MVSGLFIRESYDLQQNCICCSSYSVWREHTWASDWTTCDESCSSFFIVSLLLSHTSYRYYLMRTFIETLFACSACFACFALFPRDINFEMCSRNDATDFANECIRFPNAKSDRFQTDRLKRVTYSISICGVNKRANSFCKYHTMTSIYCIVFCLYCFRGQ